MVRLSEEIKGIPFFPVKLGKVNPTDMIIRYTFEDESKKYMVFAKSGNSNVFYLREYVGNLKDRKYFYVDDVEVIRQIDAILKCLYATV